MTFSATTLRDFGRQSEEHGQIPYFYAFPYRFWLVSQFEQPTDVIKWCQENCRGYYKLTYYTHRSSVRNTANPTKYDTRVTYVDKVYLSDDVDAVSMRLCFNISEVKVKRSEKMERIKAAAASVGVI